MFNQSINNELLYYNEVSRLRVTSKVH